MTAFVCSFTVIKKAQIYADHSAFPSVAISSGLIIRELDVRGFVVKLFHTFYKKNPLNWHETYQPMYVAGVGHKIKVALRHAITLIMLQHKVVGKILTVPPVAVVKAL